MDIDKTLQACDRCRRLKTRCININDSRSPCTNCKKRGLPCKYRAIYIIKQKQESSDTLAQLPLPPLPQQQQKQAVAARDHATGDPVGENQIAKDVVMDDQTARDATGEDDDEKEIPREDLDMEDVIAGDVNLGDFNMADVTAGNVGLEDFNMECGVTARDFSLGGDLCMGQDTSQSSLTSFLLTPNGTMLNDDGLFMDLMVHDPFMLSLPPLPHPTDGKGDAAQPTPFTAAAAQPYSCSSSSTSSSSQPPSSMLESPSSSYTYAQSPKICLLDFQPPTEPETSKFGQQHSHQANAAAIMTDGFGLPRHRPHNDKDVAAMAMLGKNVIRELKAMCDRNLANRSPRRQKKIDAMNLKYVLIFLDDFA
ncbi:hypothetical protein BKA81DRAFT_382876 [Phyllosticta paracitricarpa]|uniref:Zn(2)-C6 fungal-type domain-containing protein n=1 Tax=Phyllosticta citricarpa TaxID=55181 RepID=A0ABR1LE56_9PEZI